MIDGILPLDKPQGWTSHDAVARVRRVAGQRQVGHAGTLDPLASGLLLVVLGRGTRLSSYLMEGTKVYLADIVLGVNTVTDDAEAPAERYVSAGHIALGDIERCLPRFLGAIQQAPPLYAAVRHEGKKLYQLARQGVAVQPQPRTVRIDDIRIVEWRTPVLRLRVTCGPGTYIRSMARDIGAALGVGAYLHALRRLHSGAFSLSEGVSLSELTPDALHAALLPIDRAVIHLPAIVLSPDEADRACAGAEVRRGGSHDGVVRLYAPSGTLIALARCGGGSCKPFRVFDEGGTQSSGDRL